MENSIKLKFYDNKVLSFLENKTFQTSMILLIVLNILCLIIQTDKFLYQIFKHFIALIEIFSIIVFSIEYFLRLIIIKKFTDIFKPSMLLDLIVILPFYISLNNNLVFLRIFRFSRIFRIFKLTKYSNTVKNLVNSANNKKEELTIVAVFFILTVIITSSLMYFTEGNHQESFSSIPKAMWWAIITFTSVGYGDVTPITNMGKFIAAITAVLGVIMHGLLASVFISVFLDSFQQKENYNP